MECEFHEDRDFFFFFWSVLIPAESPESRTVLDIHSRHSTSVKCINFDLPWKCWNLLYVQFDNFIFYLNVCHRHRSILVFKDIPHSF